MYVCYVRKHFSEFVYTSFLSNTVSNKWFVTKNFGLRIIPVSVLSLNWWLQAVSPIYAFEESRTWWKQLLTSVVIFTLCSNEAILWCSFFLNTNHFSGFCQYRNYLEGTCVRLRESEWSHRGGHIINIVYYTGKCVRLFHHEDPLSFFKWDVPVVLLNIRLNCKIYSLTQLN
jgi:hypothetical protein